MRNLKKLAALVTAAVLSLSISIPAFAAVEDTGFADVDASAWYAEEAVWCRDNGVMNGTGAATFSPDRTMTRGMLATVLYRAAGSPEEIVNESCDLIYHLLVMLAACEVPLESVIEELARREQKQRNLKDMKTVDKNT